MPSEGPLFAGVYARGGAPAQVSDVAWLTAMLDVEAALARATAAEGLIPEVAGEQIASACRPEAFDLESIGREGARHASPVVALVAALRDAVQDSLRDHVHLGATSQDVLDTALMLIAKRALEPLLADARAAADVAAELADRHRATPMIGRTLLQQALALPFGLRVADWLVGIDATRARLTWLCEFELAVQMGGPVGARGPAIAARVATELGLAEPVIPWQAIRVRPAELAEALGTHAGVLGKVARDVTLLAQQEVGEVSEGGDQTSGGSSAMAHKHNPVAAVSVLACVKRIPGLVAGVLGAMEQEHERAAGAWQAEWGMHSELLALAGSATAWARGMLAGLEVDAGRMRENLRNSAVGETLLPDGAGELIDRALASHRAIDTVAAGGAG